VFSFFDVLLPLEVLRDFVFLYRLDARWGRIGNGKVLVVWWCVGLELVDELRCVGEFKVPVEMTSYIAREVSVIVLRIRRAQVLQIASVELASRSSRPEK
jgi:hypothetical protein